MSGLEDLFPRVDEAEDGANALALALAHPPGLVIADTQLARIDGYSLCQLLRVDSKTRHAGIIVVSGSGEGGDVDRAKASGADAVLIEPVSPEDVRKQAEQLRHQAAALHRGSDAVRVRAAERIERARQVMARSEAVRTRMMSRAYSRVVTTTPPRMPPDLHCLVCFESLTYEYSHLGGVSERHPEQWDYFLCVRCGRFQFRHRTRKLRRV